MKKTVFIIIITLLLFVMSSCGSDDSSDSGFKGKIYNSNDGTCAWAQETIDVFIDDNKVGTLEPGENMDYSLEKGTYVVTKYYTGTDEMTGDPITTTISGDGWYVWCGCSDGTHPLEDGSLQQGFGKVDKEAPIAITSVSWLLDSVDGSFWTSGTPATMLCDFKLSYSGETTQNDVIKVHIGDKDKDYWWTTKIKDGGAASINSTEKTLLTDYSYLFTTAFSSNADVMPIGNFRAVVVFADGTEEKFDFVLPSPGQNTSGSYEYICSQDFGGSLSDNYVKALTRPIVESADADGSAITLQYKITDSRVEDGFVNFYNSNKEDVGVTNKELSELTPSFSKDGALLTATIATTNIDFQEGYGFSDIANLVVGLKTASNPANGNSGYHRARTAFIPVN